MVILIPFAIGYRLSAVPQRPLWRALLSGMPAVLISAIAYLSFHAASALWLPAATGWGLGCISLPAGASLLLCLLFGTRGAVGVALASCCLAVQGAHAPGLIAALVSGAISGAAPCLALRLGVSMLALGPALQGLTARKLPWLALAFALISTLLQQAWGLACGHTTDVLLRAAAMAVGDWVGSLLVMYAAGLLLYSAARCSAGR